ncbi:hypothetical protein VCO01S_32610 [Vibrio comitans NBRC 102076]|uniref:Uncharacterized protein n=1 Tax=Vibrio comitans NBRC 102076 TaxID=1219078 RepID=A0A4Y3ITE0_9VIBR|nr:hypothetical protein VCO01S_32610 [Vibrio comitans NBRC 102076]
MIEDETEMGFAYKLRNGTICPQIRELLGDKKAQSTAYQGEITLCRDNKIVLSAN